MIVPEGTLTAYQATDGWNRFTNIVERSYIYGDANGDGKVNEEDINAVTTYIMGKTPQSFVMKSADINKDDKVNAADIVLINNIINNK